MSIRRVVAGSVLLAACAQVSANVQRLTPAEHEPISPDSVRIFAQLADLTADSLEFQEVAIVQLEGQPDYTDAEDLMNRARKEAALLGANGILFGNESTPATVWYQDTWSMQGTYFGSPGRYTTPRRANVLAVRWWRPARQNGMP